MAMRSDMENIMIKNKPIKLLTLDKVKILVDRLSLYQYFRKVLRSFSSGCSCFRSETITIKMIPFQNNLSI